MLDGTPVRQLVYLSHTQGEPTIESLAAIERSATRNNARRDVTGFLMYHDRRFVQLIEGERQTIGDLFDNITNDGRHRDLLVLYDAPNERRYFGSWGMRIVRFRSRGEQCDLLEPGELKLVDAMIAVCERLATPDSPVSQHLRGVRFLIEEEFIAWSQRAA